MQARDSKGNTALHYAYMHGTVSLVLLLLRHGAVRGAAARNAVGMEPALMAPASFPHGEVESAVRKAEEAAARAVSTSSALAGLRGAAAAAAVLSGAALRARKRLAARAQAPPAPTAPHGASRALLRPASLIQLQQPAGGGAAGAPAAAAGGADARRALRRATWAKGFVDARELQAVLDSARGAGAEAVDVIGVRKRDAAWRARRDALFRARQRVRRRQREEAAAAAAAATAEEAAGGAARRAGGTAGELWQACKDGDVSRVQRLLAAGASVRERDWRGWTALMVAVRAAPHASGSGVAVTPHARGLQAGSGHLEVVKTLLDVDPDTANVRLAHGTARCR